MFWNKKSDIVQWTEKMFEHSFKKEWYETYFAIDVHGTILLPNHRKDYLEANFYPYAKETMQLLSARDDIKLIMTTSSYPKEIEFYNNIFISNNIIFDYINENPEIDSTKGFFGYYEKKFYFNIMLEDKAGFRPERDWKQLYKLFKHYEKIKYFPDPNWYMKK
jgi:hypothetical protein